MMSGDPRLGDGVNELRSRIAELEEKVRPGSREDEAGVDALVGAGSAQIDNIFFRQLFENSPDAIVLLDLIVVEAASANERTEVLIGHVEIDRRLEHIRGDALVEVLVAVIPVDRPGVAPGWYADDIEVGIAHAIPQAPGERGVELQAEFAFSEIDGPDGRSEQAAKGHDSDHQSQIQPSRNEWAAE